MLEGRINSGSGARPAEPGEVVVAINRLATTMLEQQQLKDTIADKVRTGRVEIQPRAGLMAAADGGDMRPPGNADYEWAASIPAPVQLNGRTMVVDEATDQPTPGPHVEVLTPHQLDRVETGLMRTVNDRHREQGKEQFRPEVRTRTSGRVEEIIQLPIQPGGQPRPHVQALGQAAKDLGVKLQVNTKTIERFYSKIAPRLDRLEHLARVAGNELILRIDHPAGFQTPAEDQHQLVDLLIDAAIQAKLTVTKELCAAVGMDLRHSDVVDPTNPFDNLAVLQQHDQSQSKETQDLAKHIKTNVSIRGLSTSADKPPTNQAESKTQRNRRIKADRKRKHEAGRGAADGDAAAGGGRGGGRHVEIRGRGRGRGGGRGGGRGQSWKAAAGQNPGRLSGDQDDDGSTEV